MARRRTPEPVQPVDPREYVMTSAGLAAEVVAWLDRVHSQEWRLVTFGHAGMDKDLAIYPGSLTGILGRPSMGKSMLCKWLARREVRRIREGDHANECVVYVTLEEAPAVIGMALDGWDLSIQDIVRGRFDLDDAKRRAVYMVKLPLFLIRHPGLLGGRVASPLTPQRLYEAIEQLVADYPSDLAKPRMRPTLVILDYVQLLQGDDLAMSEAGKTAQVTAAIEGAKNLAARLDVPVVMAVQAGRQTDNRTDHMPAMGDAQWACLGGETIVMLGDGTWDTLQHLYQRHKARESLEVAGLVDGAIAPQPVEAAMENPPRPCLRIDVEGGDSIVATANHPFKTPRGWVPVGDLRVGDFVAVASRAPAAAHDDPRINPKRAMALGMLLGDGCLVQSVTLTKAELATRTKFGQLIEAEWPECTVSTRKQTYWDTYDTTVRRRDGKVRPGGNPVIKWLDSLGVMKRRWYDKRVPNIPMTSRSIAALVAGLIITDGSIGDGSILFASGNEALARDAQRIAVALGCVGSVQRPTGRRGVWTVLWSGGTGRRLARLILPHLVGRKRERAEKILSREGNGMGRDQRLTPEHCMAAISASVGRREPFNMVKGRCITRTRMREVARQVDRPDLAALADEPVQWHRILAIVPAGEQVTYDLQVGGAHNFIANGLVVHNSAIEQACDVVLGVHRPCRRDDLLEQIGAGERPHVTINGRSYLVNERLMVIGLVKQRAGKGTGRYPVYLDPVELELHDLEPDSPPPYVRAPKRSEAIPW